MINAGFWIGAALAALYLLSVPILLRVSRREPALIVLVAALAVYVIGTSLTALLSLQQRPSFWTISIVFWFFALCFLIAFGAIYKSLSLQMLLSLLNAPDRAMDYAALAQYYVMEHSFEDRLEVLTEKGLASFDAESRLTLTLRGEKVAKTFRCLQNIYGIEKSG